MRHVVAYLLFVGGPLIGLFGVLHLGQGLEAPIAVHGRYAVDAPASEVPACYRWLLASSDSSLAVAQSGTLLTATLGADRGVTLRGRLSDSTVELTGILDGTTAPDSVACAPQDSLHVRARVVRSTDSERLVGALAATACDGCAAVPLSAQKPRRAPGRRHP